MINNISLRSEGEKLRLGERMRILSSKKREHWKIRERGIFLKSNFILLGFALFCFICFRDHGNIYHSSHSCKSWKAERAQPIKLAAFPISLKRSMNSIRNKYPLRLLGFSRIILGNYAFIYSFICSSFIEPCYVKVTRLGTE